MTPRAVLILTSVSAVVCFALGTTFGAARPWEVPPGPTEEANKAALKQAMLEALAERFPIFGPRTDKLDIAEERKRAEADPIGTLEFELRMTQREHSVERLAGAAKDYHSDGATKEALDRFLLIVRGEIDSAEDRGSERRGR